MIAPAKLNLCLYLGPVRADGLHEICSLFIPISLADRLSVSEGAGGTDEVVCPGLPAPDLTALALRSLRDAGWQHPPLRIEVDKRIPVAAGLGGGSADAGAVLRLAEGQLGKNVGVEEIAARLGADVPSQLDPRFAIVGGAGEMVTPLPDPPPFAVVLLADGEGVPTADVYAEADRLGLGRSERELARFRGLLLAASATGAGPLDYRALLTNDLAPAAISLRPPIGAALEALEKAGAELALVAGSGPTAVGIFADDDAAEVAAAALRRDGRETIVARSVVGAVGAINGPDD